MLCNAGESKSIFMDIQNPCVLPPQVEASWLTYDNYKSKDSEPKKAKNDKKQVGYACEFNSIKSRK